MKVNDLYQQYLDIRLNLQIMIMKMMMMMMILVVLVVVAAFIVICKIAGYSLPLHLLYSCVIFLLYRFV